MRSATTSDLRPQRTLRHGDTWGLPFAHFTSWGRRTATGLSDGDAQEDAEMGNDPKKPLNTGQRVRRWYRRVFRNRSLLLAAFLMVKAIVKLARFLFDGP